MRAAEVSNARSMLRRVADRTTDWRFHCWYWGDAIAIDGLLEADALLGGPHRAHVLEILERWAQRCPPNFDDALAPGAAIVALIMQRALPPAAGDRVLAALEGLPIAYGAIPALEPHRMAFRYGLCIDALYHLPATYAMAARWTGDARFAAKAIRIALDGMQALRCRSGWAQWFDPTRRRNNEVAWTRGMGWALLGLLDLMQLQEHQGTSQIAQLAAQLIERLELTQGADGHWPAVLEHAPAESETSTACFYVAAALHPAARGLIAHEPRVLERAIAGCRAALGDDGTYTGVSADVLPSWDIESYERCPTEPSPWGQGAAVRAFAALVRAERSNAQAPT